MRQPFASFVKPFVRWFFGNVERVVDIPQTKGLHPLLDFPKNFYFMMDLHRVRCLVAMLLRLDTLLHLISSDV